MYDFPTVYFVQNAHNNYEKFCQEAYSIQHLKKDTLWT